MDAGPGQIQKLNNANTLASYGYLKEGNNNDTNVQITRKWLRRFRSY